MPTARVSSRPKTDLPAFGRRNIQPQKQLPRADRLEELFCFSGGSAGAAKPRKTVCGRKNKGKPAAAVFHKKSIIFPQSVGKSVDSCLGKPEKRRKIRGFTEVRQENFPGGAVEKCRTEIFGKRRDQQTYREIRPVGPVDFAAHREQISFSMIPYPSLPDRFRARSAASAAVTARRRRAGSARRACLR